MAVTIRPLAEADRAAAGELLAAAFPEKLAAMVGDFRALRRVLEGSESHLAFGPELFAALLPAPEPPLAWVAVADGGRASREDEGRRRASAPAPGEGEPSIVGFLQVRERHTPRHWRGHWRVFRSLLGTRQAIRAMMFFALFHSASIAEDELLVDVVAVHPEAEGQGIGSALARFALEEAARRGKTKVMLYCIERNRRARDVYVRAGFRVAHLERLWWAAWLLGFWNSYLMRAQVRGERTDFS